MSTFPHTSDSGVSAGEEVRIQEAIPVRGAVRHITGDEKMTIDILTIAGLISVLPLVLFVLVMRRRVCDDRPECEQLPAHQREGDCCPAD